MATVTAAPAPEPEADPQLLLPVPYHVPNCTVEEEVVTLQSCKPKAEEECEDVEVPSQTVEYVQSCKNVTVPHCGPQLVVPEQAAEEEPAVAVEKREAEADPQLLYHALPVVPVAPLIKHVCEDVIQQHCFPEAKVTDVTTTVKRCLVSTTQVCTTGLSTLFFRLRRQSSVRT